MIGSWGFLRGGGWGWFYLIRINKFSMGEKGD